MRRTAANAVFCALVLCACGDDAREPLTRAQLLDPETCKDCHDKHYTEWSASMHAYASRDPVFLAMNARGQEAPDGGVGDFCVNCHAPMAVREGAFANGDFTDFEQVPDHLEGVTCYFCHNVVDIEQDHNNGLVLADDTTMRGGITDPVQPEGVHVAAYSPHYDDHLDESSQLCGSCHDIVNQNGFHLERTFEEYKNTIFFKTTDPAIKQSCNDCHMDPTRTYETIAKYDRVQVPARSRHQHLWPAVDVPLTENPGREALVSAVERFMLPQSLSNFAITQVTVPSFTLDLALETAAGHRMPSGATQDRRMWLEWTAFDDQHRVIAESGTIEDDEIETGHDSITLIRDTIFSDEAMTQETHMFWEAVASVSKTIPEPQSLVPLEHTLPLKVMIPSLVAEAPKRIDFTVRMRPMGLDVLQDLVESGHLDPAVVDEMKTFTVLTATAEWPDTLDPFSFDLTVHKGDASNTDYVCKLFPDATDCD